MPRKRDFVLFGLVVLFLVIGIVSTSTWQQLRTSVLGEPAASVTVEPVERTAAMPEVVDEATLRKERLERLRAQLAAEQGSTISAPPVEEPVPTATTTEVVSVELALQCATPSSSNVPWDPRTLTLQESEGALVIYRAALTTPTVATTSVTDIPSPEVVLQLPLRTFPLKSQCIQSDIIGIAMDGSLIRNGETSLYGIFGSGTQVGYALDGFAIYGSSAGVATDECGGAVVGGSYKYFVQASGNQLLNCFMAPPVVL